MYVMSDTNPIAKRLVKNTYAAMWAGIKKVKPGAILGDIGAAIQTLAESKGYSVVKEYCGHGIGREMHEEPQVLHYGKAGTGLVLEEGMTFTIEPMINQGKAKTKTKKDGWTVVTADKKLSAQWEHTILVTKTGYEVLTLRNEETTA
jgi:methionyl aminopeptidase